MADRLAHDFEPSRERPSILSNEELGTFLNNNESLMATNDSISVGEEQEILNLDEKTHILSSDDIKEALRLVELEENALRPFRKRLYNIIAGISDLETFIAQEDYSPEEWEFRQQHGRTHNFILATVLYLQKSRQLENGFKEWNQFDRPAGFLTGVKSGSAPNLLKNIQFQTSIRSPLMKRPELRKAVAERNQGKYAANPLYKYFIDQIFDAFDRAGVPYDAFEFRNHKEITVDDIIAYLKVVGQMLSKGYQSPYNSVMFSN